MKDIIITVSLVKIDITICAKIHLLEPTHNHVSPCPPQVCQDYIQNTGVILIRNSLSNDVKVKDNLILS